MINKPLLPLLQSVCPDHCLIASRAPLNCQLGGESRAAITMGGVCLCIHSRRGEVNVRALEVALNTRVLHSAARTVSCLPSSSMQIHLFKKM